jgi:pimeloyl-ACP methyl ester carboxylesterase
VSNQDVILLPGLDGTGKLFNRFIRSAPSGITVEPLPLPAAAVSYEDLVTFVVRVVPDNRYPIIIAESFSGPVAVGVATRRNLKALIFCNSFVSSPGPRGLRWLVNRLAFRWVPPSLVRRFLVGPCAPDELVSDVIEAIRSVPARVLADRVRAVLRVDETATFAASDTPALYLRGTEDRFVSSASYRRMATLRHLTVLEVAGPHLLLQANPVGAWDAILSFLAKLDSRLTAG